MNGAFWQTDIALTIWNSAAAPENVAGARKNCI
jgi:hypothetical protein